MTLGTPRLVVVGGGILGTMHAVEGVRRGYEVVQLERDDAPRSASVRNFGLVWVSGRAAGRELDLALRARERWEEIAAVHSEIGFRSCGSLTIARTDAELRVIEEAAAFPDAAQRGFSLLSAAQACVLNPAVSPDVAGALHCALDAAVEPRRVLGALREHLTASGSYTFLAGRAAIEFDSHDVLDETGQRHEGDLVVLCPGADPGTLLVEAFKDAPLRRVRLQMLETEPFRGDVATALADGDSLRYYPAFRELAAAHLPAQDPLAASWGAQLLLVQRRTGHLTIGDTHRYDEPFDFDLDDRPTAHLLDAARAVLSTPLPPVERRWAGIYSEVTDPAIVYLRRELAPGVVVVTGPGGRGMSLSPAIAEETFT